MADSKTIALACDGDYANTSEGKALRESLTLSDLLQAYSNGATE